MFFFYLTSDGPSITLDIPHDNCYQTWARPRLSVYFLRFLFWFCVLMLRYLGSPEQPRQYKQWRSILILSNYIRSLRERDTGSNTIQHLHCYLLSTNNINLSHNLTHTVYWSTSHRYKDIADRLKANAWLISHVVYYILYCSLVLSCIL